MNKFTVISVNDNTGEIYADHIEAVDPEQAMAQIGPMRQSEDLHLVICIPGYLSEAYTVEGQDPSLGLVFPGECVVDAHQYAQDDAENRNGI